MTGRGRPKIAGQRIEYIEPLTGELDTIAKAEGISRPELTDDELTFYTRQVTAALDYLAASVIE